MIKDVDKSEVLDCGVISSSVLGMILPVNLSGWDKNINFNVT